MLNSLELSFSECLEAKDSLQIFGQILFVKILRILGNNEFLRLRRVLI